MPISYDALMLAWKSYHNAAFSSYGARVPYNDSDEYRSGTATEDVYAADEALADRGRDLLRRANAIYNTAAYHLWSD